MLTKNIKATNQKLKRKLQKMELHRLDLYTQLEIITHSKIYKLWQRLNDYKRAIRKSLGLTV